MGFPAAEIHRSRFPPKSAARNPMGTSQKNCWAVEPILLTQLRGRNGGCRARSAYAAHAIAHLTTTVEKCRHAQAHKNALKYRSSASRHSNASAHVCRRARKFTRQAVAVVARITQIATPLRPIRTGHAARTNRDTALDRQVAELKHSTHSSFESELERVSASARLRPASGQDYRRHQITLHAMATAGSHPDNACATDIRCVRARYPRKTRRDARFASLRAYTRRFGRSRAVFPRFVRVGGNLRPPAALIRAACLF